MPKQTREPSFAERRERLAKAAEDLEVMSIELSKIEDVVSAEVEAMIAAEKRFSERRIDKRPARR